VNTRGRAPPANPAGAERAATASLGEAVQAMRINRPLRAEEICREYLLLRPGSAPHLRILGHSLMKQNRLHEAEEQIRFALTLQPDFPQLHEDLGAVLALQQRFKEAIPCFETALRLEPTLQLARKKLAQALAALGRGAEADEAFLEYFAQDEHRQALMLGAEHLQAGRSAEASAAFRAVLKAEPDNVDAMRLLAMVWSRERATLADAEALLRRAIALAPDYAAIILNLGAVLLARGRRVEAIDVYLQAVRVAPHSDAAWGGMANAYALAHDTDKSVAAYARAVAINPDNAHAQMGYAHVLKAVGEQDAAVAAYRTAVKIKPSFGEVYWSMANLKTFRFEDHDILAMEQGVATPGLNDSTAAHFHFALGKAYEDRMDFARAWRHYDSGNRLQRPLVSHDPLAMEIQQTAIIEVFSASFLEAHAGCGCAAPDPIFIVGLPRSGSTLIEQILASHSQVEGTAELPNLGMIAVSIGRYRADGVEFPEALRELRDKDWRAYGKQYIDETRRVRHTERPFFTDKLPNNFSLVGFLHVILPNARVINARRHPLDTLLGNYKQLYGKGQDFTYDLVDLAEYYRQYDRVMKHWRHVLPGKVLDVHYEDTVFDLEGQVRRILAHCNLPFEAACVQFHENPRPVKTASSEQVRRPIYTSALGLWRQYDQQLGYWREELADIIAELPERVRNAGL
jgi:tetratricopeptide (TPR) repeat protein